MRVEVVDPSGHGLGLAIGLLELGHRVRYVPARSEQVAGQLDGMRRELIAHMFGGGEPFVGEADLLVLVDVFADYLHCLEQGVGTVGSAEPRDPLQADAGILIYPKRLQWFCERALRTAEVVVVDMSDRDGPREVAFEAMPHVQRFARELPGGREVDGWRPLPFLFNTAMLWLEYTRAQQEWWIERRPEAWDWAFCGTVDHGRYRGRRRERLGQLASDWPALRGLVIGEQPFQDVLGTLQSVRFGLDLPGVGELCFRLHECLALGVPVWRPDPGRVHLPPGLDDLVFADPAKAPRQPPTEIRSAYLRHYAPLAAATHLLKSCRTVRGSSSNFRAFANVHA